MMIRRCLSLFLFMAFHTSSISSWTSGRVSKSVSDLRMSKEDGGLSTRVLTGANRRQMLGSLLGGSLLLFPTLPSVAVERAVGGAEKKCREAGNCLEIGEWDGAVGWSWGGKDRCDPTDPLCGPNGQLMDAPPAGESVPPVVATVTHLVELNLDIGKNESATIRFGLYGQDCPKSVSQLVDFVTSKGIVTMGREDTFGISSAPVFLENGGILNGIVPQQRLDFGVPSQAAAYARSRGRARAGDDFVPQPRPKDKVLSAEPFVRKHDTAGLVSVPGNGIGYGGSGLESEDEAFSSSFDITAGPVSSMDKEGRRVIGQVLDDASMGVVARLASLPTKKGLKGVIPGQNSGPPLLKVKVQEIFVKKVSGSDSQNSS